jgi:hypothetical protein
MMLSHHLIAIPMRELAVEEKKENRRCWVEDEGTKKLELFSF